MSKVIVYAPGVWDMLHIGHIKFLERAKALGDFLVVGVQSDESVEGQKGTKPIIPLNNRIAVLERLKCVDIAIPYDDFDYFHHAQRCNASVFATSDTYRNTDKFKVVADGMKICYLPHEKGISSTMIKETVTNQWHKIWDKVALSDKNDYEVVGHDCDKTWTLADFIISQFPGIHIGRVLDYGCGAGLLFKFLKINGIGIDISQGMIDRAKKNCPNSLFIRSDNIPLDGHVDYILSWGVLHYLPSLSFVSSVVDKMKNLSSNILLMELPDAELREKRLAYRKKNGKILDPEPLYFDKQFFIDKGFEVVKDYPQVTDNAKFSFSVIYKGARP